MPKDVRYRSLVGAPNPTGGPPVPKERSYNPKIGEERRGIISDWEPVLKTTIHDWSTKGGCQLTRKESCEGKYLFNYWPAEVNPIIELEELEDDDMSGTHVAADRAPDAPVEYAELPYLKRTAVTLRPSLMAFTVTGHVMLGIYYGMLKRPELHILNPWSLLEKNETTGATQLRDVYKLFEEKLKGEARKVAYIDVANEVEKENRMYINLQENERVGFCTLWVPIMADAVIPKLPALTTAMTSGPATSGLKPSVKALYTEIYKTLQTELTTGMEDVKDAYPLKSVDITNLAAAKAVVDLYRKAVGLPAKAGKRKSKRRTYRKKPTWRQRHGRRSTRRA
jgi:hypothetical protein